MQAPPPRTPTEWFAGILLSLSLAVDGPGRWGWLSRPLALLLQNLIREIHQAFAGLAACIAAGEYVPRHPQATPCQEQPRSPLGPDKLPQTFARQAKPLPEMAAAPAIGRRLRPLCRMLRVPPPKILAPAATRPKKPKKLRYVFSLRYPPPLPDPT